MRFFFAPIWQSWMWYVRRQESASLWSMCLTWTYVWHQHWASFSCQHGASFSWKNSIVFHHTPGRAALYNPTHPNASWQDAIWTPKTYLKHQTSAAIWIFGCPGLESRCTFEQLDPHHVCNISELWACLEWLSHVALQRLSEILPLKKGSKSGQLVQSGSL